MKGDIFVLDYIGGGKDGKRWMNWSSIRDV